MLEITRGECLDLLASHRFGRLAVCTGSGPPLIRPVNYRFDGPSQSVVFRTARGSKFRALIRSTQAAFEIDGIEPRSHTGWSVIIQGVTEEVTRPGDIRRLDALGLEPWAPGDRPHWFHIRAWTVRGRRIVLESRNVTGRKSGPRTAGNSPAGGLASGA